MAVKKLQVRIDQNMCQGIGYCEQICPSVFSVDKVKLLAQVKVAEVTDPALFEHIQSAEQTCPTRAIEVVTIEE
jgi:ferredoxin